MLELLRMTNVGPAPEIRIELKPRINIVTGDNGLGKSFLLDVAWWVLTRTWARRLVLPHPAPAVGEIEGRFTKRTAAPHTFTSQFDRSTEEWSKPAGRPAMPGLVLYAQVDGGFSVWDPARNYWRMDSPDRPEAFRFVPEEVWEGNELCEGLIRDWASWQLEAGEPFRQLGAVLSCLSPSDTEPLAPGELRRIALNDPRRHPTLRMPYGQDVPLVHASAGMRRIIALAYLLVWAWQEHRSACQLLGQQPSPDIIFLIDEVEAHLHPQWQRRIAAALLEVMETLTGEHQAQVQLIAATHSPLLLASIEPLFDDQQDGLFLLELVQTRVLLREQAWSMQGDVGNWLVSDSFGLRQGRSIQAERAIEAAEAWMRGERDGLPAELATKDAIDEELRRVLASHDPFWPRWIVRSGDGSSG